MSTPAKEKKMDMDQVQEIKDALSVYVGQNVRFVIYPPFADQQQVNTQKLVVSGFVKEIVEADGGWGGCAQVVFEGGATFLFQNYQTEWEIGKMGIHGRMKCFHKDPTTSKYHVEVSIGPAW